MSNLIESFTAVDDEQREYVVDVHGVMHAPLSGRRAILDYSLRETGEVLRKLNDAPLVLEIGSTDTAIVDPRTL